MKTILFYWSKGADIRRKIIKLIDDCEKKKDPCFLNLLAKHFNISHVAIKKHIDLLIDEKFVETINPDGKPVYLRLTKTGKKVLKEFKMKGERKKK